MDKNSTSILVLLIIISVIAGVFVYQPLWSKFSDAKPWSLGLDLSGGSFLVYSVDLSGVDSSDQDTVISGLRDVLERRVNLFGVSEPRVYVQDADGQKRLVVELAGIKDVSQAIEEIGETPTLDFREAVESDSQATESDDEAVSGDDSSEDAELSTSTLATSSESPTQAGGDMLSTTGYEFIETELTGRYIEGAQVAFDQYTGQPYVTLNLTSEGGVIFEELTERLVGRPLAIFLDDQLIEMPTVQEKITGGQARITGGFDIDEANTLVSRFNAGALPAPIELINQKTISPALGHDSLEKSVFAGAIGLLLVMIYMVAYYRKLGLFAVGALLMYVVLTLAIFKLIPITLTLSGIAAVVLSIGMAVDANILVFERMKEELDRGLSFPNAVEEGFDRAWTSIRDANITTIISAIVLYYITSSFVQGFALALIIGVLVSMFSAVTITRAMLRVYCRSKSEQ